jgi:hypothetical protein
MVMATMKIIQEIVKIDEIIIIKVDGTIEEKKIIKIKQ